MKPCMPETLTIKEIGWIRSINLIDTAKRGGRRKADIFIFNNTGKTR